MTGPGAQGEPRSLGRRDTTAGRRSPVGTDGCGTGSPDGLIERTCASHKPCPAEDVPSDVGDGIGVPSPQEAYANAPDQRREMHQVIALGAERDGRRVGSVAGPPADAAVAERAWLLRRAALMDRVALETPGPGPAGAAARTAEEILRYDHRHPDLVAGPLRPDAITPGGGLRLYVRQEYAAWTAAMRPGA
ncbi:hypothetical protein [Streptomyces sp. NPDC048106]|uniref:hypothetical protein n=1 Tax=Streptomyces sp. NPDC048106 TaxID=3155750 RepID=UPI003456B55C